MKVNLAEKYPPFTTTLTFKLLIVNAAIILVGLIPGLGLLALAILVGSYAAFLMPHVLAFAMLREVFLKRLPMIFLLVPVLMYGGYYFLYFSQTTWASVIESQLKYANPKMIMKYNPAIHDLVLPNEEDAKKVVGSYNLPLSYVAENKRMVSFRLVSLEKCQEMDKLGVLAKSMWDYPQCKWIAYWNNPSRFRISVENAVIFASDEVPAKEKIEVSVSHSTDDKDSLLKYFRVHRRTYTFSYQGKEIGKFVTASYSKLRKFPFGTFLCFFGPPGGVECSHMFPEPPSRQNMNTFPGDTGLQLFEHPIGAMLQIDSYPTSMLTSFKDFPENAAITDHLIEQKKAEVKH